MAHVDLVPVPQRGRVLLHGGSGWLGRELVASLIADGSIKSDDILVLGSRHRVIDLAGTPIQVFPYALDLAQRFRPKIVVHLASLTREHLSHVSLTDFVTRNHQLLEQGLTLSQLETVSSVVSVSSGAALRDDGPYGEIKRDQEAAFERINEGPRRAVLNARVWSVSGRYCTKPDVFALTSMIRDAKRTGVVQVENPRLVYRRYVDAGEYLRLCLEAASRGIDFTIDSSGDLVELRELAERIGAHYGAAVRYAAAETGEPDDYYTNDESMWVVASRLGHSFTGLEGQIIRTGANL